MSFKIIVKRQSNYYIGKQNGYRIVLFSCDCFMPKPRILCRFYDFRDADFEKKIISSREGGTCIEMKCSIQTPMKALKFTAGG